MSIAIELDREKIAAFCRKWRITEMSLFGSVLRDDFRPDSDVDVMVSFEPEARWGLFAVCEMEEELRTLLGRPVDLVTRGAVERSENYIRRRNILQDAETIYAQG